MGTATTPNLDLLRIQETWQFSDEGFNRFIDDADEKLVGVSHLDSPKHWVDWKKNTFYSKDDVVRVSNSKSHQYYQCLVAGISGDDEPTDNVTGSIIEDGTIKWEIKSLSEASIDGSGSGSGGISIWLSGKYYHRGDSVIYFDSSSNMTYGGLGKGAYGILYRCTVDHFASNMVNDFQSGYWQQVAANIANWNPSTYYHFGDIVEYNKQAYRYIRDVPSKTVYRSWRRSTNYTEDSIICRLDDNSHRFILYRCLETHDADNDDPTSEYTFLDDAHYWRELKLNQLPLNSATKDMWEVVFDSSAIQEFKYGQTYYPGDIVSYQGALFYIHSHPVVWYEGSSDVEDDPFYDGEFDLLTSTIPNWDSNIFYASGQLVAYKNIIYKCVQPHWSIDFYTDRLNWNIFHNNIVDWQGDDYYEVGQVVRYNNCLYECNTSHDTFSHIIELYPLKWRAGQNYSVDSSVINGTTLYVCKLAHQSTDFAQDIDNWTEIKDLSVGQSTWQPVTVYMNKQIVKYGGLTFECISEHISSQNFLDDISHWSTEIKINNAFELNQEKWDIIYSSIQDWKRNVVYKVGSTVIYDGIIFKCIQLHKSDVFMNESTNWQQLGKADAVVGNWQPATKYWKSQLILNEGVLYRCKVNHISSTVKFIADYANWEVVSASISEWDIGQEYIVGDIVIYNNLLYKCVVTHTATDFAVDINDWELLCGISAWTPDTTYKSGAIIVYDGVLYRVVSSFTSGSVFNDTNLEKIGGIGGAVEWTPNTDYSENQLVIHDKLLYRVIDDFTSGELFNKTYLSQITIGWTAYWQPYTYYTVGETVVQANSIIRCAVAHTSLATYNTAEATNWVIIASAQAIITYWTPNTQYTNGNAVIHNDILYICNITHISSPTFAEDMVVGYEKWRTINTSATSGSWEQVTKLGVVAPRIVEIIINNTSTFCTSPVEVLKFNLGTQDQSINEFTFVAGDGQRFTVDDVRADTNMFVIFDGQVRLRTNYIYPLRLETQTNEGYIHISDSIDLSVFKHGEDLVVR